jgi:hypothetical protein
MVKFWAKAPAGTATVEGTVSAVLLVVTSTTIPVLAFERVIVQVALAPTARAVGVHVRAVKVMFAQSVRTWLFDWPAKVPVIVADWSAGMEAAAVAVKVAVVAPAETVTEAGTGSRALLLDSVTTKPPVGAALERVAVQAAVALVFREVGVQVSE